MSVYRVHMYLQPEGGGRILSYKSGRIHDTDISAGEYQCALKIKEIIKDLEHFHDRQNAPGS